MAAAATVRACDCGRSNCKKLVDELGVPITVCYLPPGTSKWNKIEHRLFSFITGNWRSKPLVSHQVIVQRIAYSDEAGRGFRSEAGRCSDVKPATIPI